MKRNYLPILTLIGISITVLAFSFISFKYTYQTTKEELLQSQLQSGQREAREIAKLLEQQLKSGLSKDQVINNLQSSILNTDAQTEFICMYNTKGIELCHPNPALVGQIISEENSLIKTGGKQEAETFLQWLQQGKNESGIRSFPDSKRSSEIVNIYPVANTDWVVALHVNMKVLTAKFSSLYFQFFLTFLITALIVTLCCYLLVRFLYRRYEQKMESQNSDLTRGMEDLALLNQQLNESQKRLQNELLASSPIATVNAPEKTIKKRLVTYHRNELIKLDVDDIAFIFLKNGTTYLNTFDNLSYTTSDRLDEIMKDMDTEKFYRANRQVIVNIRAIQTIQLYGSNQLKLITEPIPEMEIIVSKNKVAEFKQWLNQ
ncbi:MAG: LytTR family transcriptional regulator DNA-binding domain-containing protein [Ginsengibacter sp.]